MLLIFLLHFTSFSLFLPSFFRRMMCEASMGQFEIQSAGHTELMGMIWMKHIINSKNIQNNFRLLSWKIIVGIRKHFSLHVTTLIWWEKLEVVEAEFSGPSKMMIMATALLLLYMFGLRRLSHNREYITFLSFPLKYK